MAHVAHSREGQPNDRASLTNAPGAFVDQRVAHAPAGRAGVSGLLVSARRGRRFRGRVFLAWLPAMLSTSSTAAREPALLENEGRSESPTRSQRNAQAPSRR